MDIKETTILVIAVPNRKVNGSIKKKAALSLLIKLIIFTYVFV